MSIRALLSSLALLTVASAQDDPASAAPAPKQARPLRTAEQILARYSPRLGTVEIGDVARLRLAEGWVWLAGADGRKFLKDCGNLPGSSTLGVAVPPDFGASQMFAVYSYADDGHVDDSEQPDYDQLLVDMKAAAAEDSAERKQKGLEGAQLLGWAEPPHYDKQQHKLYWAERLQFDGAPGETLNYNVRVLGRSGHLVVNGVGDIAQLPVVAARSKELLAATEFVEGKRYTDFDPAYDKVAAYGIGGLIATKLALKVGLFAKLGLLVVKFLKPILVGVALIVGIVLKVVGARRKKEQPAQA